MSDTEDFKSTQLSVKKMRRTYLITYSQANRELFPTRESFGRAIAEAFNSGSSKVKVDYWACALENHKNGGEHYHTSVKLTGPKRWLAVKHVLSSRYDIVVNFSESHDNYYSAFKYICKSDIEVFHSAGHPNLKEIGSPRTKMSTKAYRKSKQKNVEQSQEGSSQSTSKKPKRLSNFDVSEFLVENALKSTTELFAKANEQKKAGKTDLASFVLSRSSKALNDLIDNTWEMEGASAKVARKDIPRMDMIRKSSQGECVIGCDGLWLESAQLVLRHNRVHPFVFAEALRKLMLKGRGKHRNIMIIGPANCGKTFLLQPLSTIFRVFANPAENKYAWLEAVDAEIIFLNDFRWSKEMIAWKELLLLLEGQPVHFPAPKNIYAKDLCLSQDTPVVATSKARITFERNGTSDEIENEMMEARWRVFEFSHQIPKEEQKEIEPCARCFCELTLLGEI